MTQTIVTSLGFGKERRGRLVVLSVVCLWLLWLLGQVFRDATWPSGLLFYIPSPILLLLLLGGSFRACRAKRRAVACLLAGLALVPAIVILCVENRFGAAKPDRPAGKTLRLVHWNIFRGNLGWDGIQNTLRQCNADIYVISEISRAADIEAIAKSFGEEYSGVRVKDLAVVARGSLQKDKVITRKNGVDACGLVWQSPQGGCRVLVIDLRSSLLLAREPRLLETMKLMVDWRADIVVGDFNAPRRSRALSPLPPGFAHAYEAAGSGWSYTWPVPFPVYAIDQCILGQRIRPLSYDLESSWRSDHRLQVLDFMIGKEDSQDAAGGGGRY